MKEVSLDFGRIEIHDDFVVVEISSGVDLDGSKFDLMKDLFEEEFQGAPYGYITNRINDYSLNPTDAKRALASSNVVCAAFVMKRQVSFSSFESERYFYDVPVKAFSNLKEAKVWVEQRLKRAVEPSA